MSTKFHSTEWTDRNQNIMSNLKLSEKKNTIHSKFIEKDSEILPDG